VADNTTVQRREWIPNVIENNHTSGRAAAIATDCDSKYFKHQRLARHRGGLLGSKRLQTYGTGSVWQDMRFDFFVSSDPQQIQFMVEQGYDQRCTVFTTGRICVANPGRFYLIPYLPQIDVLAMPIYLAAFDGHSEVFMLGYCLETTGGSRTWHRASRAGSGRPQG
jgi:hypothetical protein